MTDLCALCLSADRNLSIINQELLEVLIPLLKASNFSIFKLTGRILNLCWECRARLKGIQSFRKMALTSLKYMFNYWDCNKNIQPKKSYSRLITTMSQVLDIKEDVYFEVEIEDDIVLNKKEREFGATIMMASSNNLIEKKYEFVKKSKMKTRRRLFDYKEHDLNKALEAIKNKTMGKREACRFYGVPRTTVSDRLSGKVPNKKHKVGPDPVLGCESEDKLKDWLLDKAKCGYPIKKKYLIETVSKIIQDTGIKNPFKGGKPGNTWCQLFLRRHPEISLQCKGSCDKIPVIRLS